MPRPLSTKIGEGQAFSEPQVGGFRLKGSDLVRRKPVPIVFPAAVRARLQRGRSTRAILACGRSLRLLRKQMSIPRQVVFCVWRGVATVQRACLQIFEKEYFGIYVVQL